MCPQEDIETEELINFTGESNSIKQFVVSLYGSKQYRKTLVVAKVSPMHGDKDERFLKLIQT